MSDFSLERIVVSERRQPGKANCQDPNCSTRNLKIRLEPGSFSVFDLKKLLTQIMPDSAGENVAQLKNYKRSDLADPPHSPYVLTFSLMPTTHGPDA